MSFVACELCCIEIHFWKELIINSFIKLVFTFIFFLVWKLVLEG